MIRKSVICQNCASELLIDDTKRIALCKNCGSTVYPQLSYNNVPLKEKTGSLANLINNMGGKLTIIIIASLIAISFSLSGLILHSPKKKDTKSSTASTTKKDSTSKSDDSDETTETTPSETSQSTVDNTNHTTVNICGIDVIIPSYDDYENKDNDNYYYYGDIDCLYFSEGFMSDSLNEDAFEELVEETRSDAFLDDEYGTVGLDYEEQKHIGNCIYAECTYSGEYSGIELTSIVGFLYFPIEDGGYMILLGCICDSEDTSLIDDYNKVVTQLSSASIDDLNY